MAGGSHVPGPFPAGGSALSAVEPLRLPAPAKRHAEGSVRPGGAARLDTQPINHVATPLPPLFLATGTADETVLPRNSRNLAAPLRWLGPVLDDVDAFLESLPDAGS